MIDKVKSKPEVQTMPEVIMEEIEEVQPTPKTSMKAQEEPMEQ